MTRRHSANLGSEPVRLHGSSATPIDSLRTQDDLTPAQLAAIAEQYGMPIKPWTGERTYPEIKPVSRHKKRAILPFGRDDQRFNYDKASGRK